MADGRKIIISELLWFFNRYSDKFNDNDKFKSSVISFYTAAEFQDAHKVLLYELETLKKEKVKLSSKGNTRAEKANDIIEMFNLTSSEKIRDNLPLFAVIAIERLPNDSCQFDSISLVDKFSKIEKIIDDNNNICKKIWSSSLKNNNNNMVTNNSHRYASSVKFGTSKSNSTQPSRPPSSAITTEWGSDTNLINDDNFNKKPANPNPNNNTNDDNIKINSQSDDSDNDFKTVVNKNKKRKLTNMYTTAVKSNIRKCSGKSKLDLGFAANDPPIKKSILYVGNLTFCKTEVIAKHLEKAGFDLISLHPIKKKEKDSVSNNENIDGSTSFRLCLPLDQSSKIFDDDLWPMNTVVRDWTFQDKPQTV
ncbi:hypothetical protein HELRODRAFT_166733 [Helobdella robusta]|uniref:Uncharacterized protein n=1 Tax=Helobdella robusta TaxID=6412 RepID=T1EYG0_HELRO|nr:hypothetical protein HELRODRAFT_166733 [Helobdella robusta]ESO11715.1 hypothetical protein HELRODRAFT_166733 [Helobdella robusta]